MTDKRTIVFNSVIIDLQKNGEDLLVSFWKHAPELPQAVEYFGEITKKGVFKK